jgi:hypothetical protein
MKWIVTTAQAGIPGRTITSTRTLREAMDAGRRWLERHPASQRCYAHDTRGGRTSVINRSRTARRNTGGTTFKDRGD